MFDIKEKILEAFRNAVSIYKEQMKNFYPTIGNRGIDERNQVYIFLFSLREILGNKIEMASWLELPFIAPKKTRDRLDGGAYIHRGQDNYLVLIEAKRIKQGKTKGTLNTDIAFGKILRDAERMSEMERITTFSGRIKNDSIKVCRVMIGDIWLNHEKHMHDAKKKWLNGQLFPSDWKNGKFEISEEIYNGGYHLLIAIHPDLIILEKTL